MKKHKHHDALIKYAEGWPIEYQSVFDGAWLDTKNPAFSPSTKYRVKSPNRPMREAFEKGDIIQWREKGEKQWQRADRVSLYNLTVEYRVHPCNELIKKYEAGTARIQFKKRGNPHAEWTDAASFDPRWHMGWHEEFEYRERPAPETVVIKPEVVAVLYPKTVEPTEPVGTYFGEAIPYLVVHRGGGDSLMLVDTREKGNARFTPHKVVSYGLYNGPGQSDVLRIA